MLDIPIDIPRKEQIAQAIEQLRAEGWPSTICNIAEKLNLRDAEMHRWMADAIDSDRVEISDGEYFVK